MKEDALLESFSSWVGLVNYNSLKKAYETFVCNPKMRAVLTHILQNEDHIKIREELLNPAKAAYCELAPSDAFADDIFPNHYNVVLIDNKDILLSLQWSSSIREITTHLITPYQDELRIFSETCYEINRNSLSIPTSVSQILKLASSNIATNTKEITTKVSDLVVNMLSKQYSSKDTDHVMCDQDITYMESLTTPSFEDYITPNTTLTNLISNSTSVVNLSEQSSSWVEPLSNLVTNTISAINPSSVVEGAITTLSNLSNLVINSTSEVNPDEESSGKESSGMSPEKWVVVGVAMFLAACTAGAGFYYCYYRHKNKKMKKQSSDDTESNHTEDSLLLNESGPCETVPTSPEEIQMYIISENKTRHEEEIFHAFNISIPRKLIVEDYVAGPSSYLKTVNSFRSTEFPLLQSKLVLQNRNYESFSSEEEEEEPVVVGVGSKWAADSSREGGSSNEHQVTAHGQMRESVLVRAVTKGIQNSVQETILNLFKDPRFPQKMGGEIPKDPENPGGSKTSTAPRIKLVLSSLKGKNDSLDKTDSDNFSASNRNTVIDMIPPPLPMEEFKNLDKKYNLKILTSPQNLATASGITQEFDQSGLHNTADLSLAVGGDTPNHHDHS